MRLLFASMLLAPLAAVRASAAPAVPLVLAHEGQLLDENDRPLAGTQQLKFTLYDISNPVNGSAGTDLWHETYAATVDVFGRYSVILGDDSGGKAPLTAAVFPAGADRWLQISVNGVDLAPRLRIGSVPFALLASDAATVGGQAPSAFAPAAGAATIATVGTVEAGTWGATPIDDEHVASAAAWNAKLGAVTVAAPLSGDGTTAHPLTSAVADASHDGVLAQGDFQKFAAAATAAATTADATHAGVLAASDWTRFDRAAQLVAGAGALTVGGAATFNAATMFNGAARFGSSGSLVLPQRTTPGTCTPGELFFVASSNSYYGCSSTGPFLLGGGGQLGDSAANPAGSCAAIRSARPDAVDGMYWLLSPGNVTFQTFCDMTTDGGGWTRFKVLNIPVADPNWQTPSQIPYVGAIPALPAHTRAMVQLQIDNHYAWASWDVGSNTADRWLIDIVDILQATVSNGHWAIDSKASAGTTNLKLQMWSNCYNQDPATGVYDSNNVPNASVLCHGEFASYENGVTLWAFSHFEGSGTTTVGIGNQPSGQPDWTGDYNAGSFTTRVLTWYLK